MYLIFKGNNNINNSNNVTSDKEISQFSISNSSQEMNSPSTGIEFQQTFDQNQKSQLDFTSNLLTFSNFDNLDEDLMTSLLNDSNKSNTEIVETNKINIDNEFMSDKSQIKSELDESHLNYQRNKIEQLQREFKIQITNDEDKDFFFEDIMSSTNPNNFNQNNSSSDFNENQFDFDIQEIQEKSELSPMLSSPSTQQTTPSESPSVAGSPGYYSFSMYSASAPPSFQFVNQANSSNENMSYFINNSSSKSKTKLESLLEIDSDKRAVNIKPNDNSNYL